MDNNKKKPQIILNIFFCILCAMIVLPLIMIVSASFSSETAIAEHGYGVLPREIDLSAYKYVFKNPQSLIDAYKVTFAFSIIFMVLSVLLMAMVAYPLTKKYLRGRKAISFYLYFTMLFSGGLVPSYILMTKYLQLGDTFWIYILTALISPWYVFMMRTFFNDIPGEIAESMEMDGASEYTIFFRMVLPLSKPVLATVALFMFLSKWNDWYVSMLYIDNQKLVSLQYLLQRIMQNIQLIQENAAKGITVAVDTDIPSETVRMAMAVLVAGPALFVFPFFQKYFVKGLTVGSVKG